MGDDRLTSTQDDGGQLSIVGEQFRKIQQRSAPQRAIFFLGAVDLVVTALLVAPKLWDWWARRNEVCDIYCRAYNPKPTLDVVFPIGAVSAAVLILLMIAWFLVPQDRSGGK